MRHRDTLLQIALVRWFPRSFWSCRYSDSLGCQPIARRKEGSTRTTARPSLWQIPKYRCCPSSSFHLRTAPAIFIVQYSGAWHSPHLPFSVLFLLSPWIDSHTSPHILQRLRPLFLARRYISDCIPLISNFHRLDHRQRRCLGPPPFPIRFHTSARRRKMPVRSLKLGDPSLGVFVITPALHDTLQDLRNSSVQRSHPELNGAMRTPQDSLAYVWHSEGGNKKVAMRGRCTIP